MAKITIDEYIKMLDKIRIAFIVDFFARKLVIVVGIPNNITGNRKIWLISKDKTAKSSMEPCSLTEVIKELIY